MDTGQDANPAVLDAMRSKSYVRYVRKPEASPTPPNLVFSQARAVRNCFCPSSGIRPSIRVNCKTTEPKLKREDEAMAAKKSSGGGGIKGFLTRAGSSFYAGGMYAKEKGMWLAQKAGRIGFIIATTSIVTLMPLIFEITREGQVRAGCLRLLQRFASMIQYIHGRL